MKLILFLLLVVTTFATAASVDDAIAQSFSGQLAEAKSTLSSLLTADPHNARAAHALGQIAAREGDWEAAIKYFKMAIESDPKFSDAVRDLGGANLAQAQKSKSLIEAFRGRGLLKKAVEMDPANVANQIALIQFYRQAPFFIGGGRSKAEAQIEELRKADGYTAAMIAVEMYSEAKDWRTCVAELKRAEQIKPDDLATMMARATVAAESGLELAAGRAAALRLKESSSSTKTQRASACVQLGRMAERGGDLKEAVAEYRDALDLDPSSSDARKGADRVKALNPVGT